MTPTGSSSAVKSRLSLKEWKEIERLFASGEVTLQELAARFQTPVRTIQAHLNKAGIAKGMSTEISDSSQETSQTETSFQEDVKTYQAEARKIALLMAEHVKAGLERLSPGPAHANQLFKLGSAANKMNQFAKELGIALESEESIPVLQVIEITAEQIEKMRELQRQEDEELCPHLHLERVLEETYEPEGLDRTEEDDEIISEGEIDGPCCLLEEDI
jgi:hypothetical protein